MGCVLRLLAYFSSHYLYYVNLIHVLDLTSRVWLAQTTVPVIEPARVHNNITNLNVKKMRNKLQQNLFVEFPFLYGHMRGLEIQDGWYDILYKMSWRISNYIVTSQSGLSLQDVAASCVKEKFGGLRVYLNTKIPNTYIDGIVSDAMTEAWETCECCGYPGSLRQDGWWQTLCDVCNAERHRAP